MAGEQIATLTAGLTPGAVSAPSQRKLFSHFSVSHEVQSLRATAVCGRKGGRLGIWGDSPGLTAKDQWTQVSHHFCLHWGYSFNREIRPLSLRAFLALSSAISTLGDFLSSQFCGSDYWITYPFLKIRDCLIVLILTSSFMFTWPLRNTGNWYGKKDVPVITEWKKSTCREVGTVWSISKVIMIMNGSHISISLYLLVELLGPDVFLNSGFFGFRLGHASSIK